MIWARQWIKSKTFLESPIMTNRLAAVSILESLFLHSLLSEKVLKNFATPHSPKQIRSPYIHRGRWRTPYVTFGEWCGRSSLNSSLCYAKWSRMVETNAFHIIRLRLVTSKCTGRWLSIMWSRLLKKLKKYSLILSFQRTSQEDNPDAECSDF